VALLQIDAVGATLWGKTLAITTFMLALAALLSSVIVLIDRDLLLQASVVLRWQEVAHFSWSYTCIQLTRMHL